jgi:hypothetical protein
VVEAHRGTRRLRRGARRQRVVDDGKAPARNLAPDDRAQRRHQAEQPEPAVFKHPVISLPAEPRRQDQKCLRDMTAAGQHGAGDQFPNRGPRRFRDGQHDLPEPFGKGRRKAGFMMRFHVAYGRLVSHPSHGAGSSGDTLFETGSQLPTHPD